MFWWLLIPICLLLIGGLFCRRRSGLSARDIQNALESFPGPTAELSERFRVLADSIGKPRGLRWTQCELATPVRFTQDRNSGELYAAIAATISFEAIPGGGMEEVTAVGNLRAGTALFTWRQVSWEPTGRALFNLSPEEVVEKYSVSLREIQPVLPVSSCNASQK